MYERDVNCRGGRYAHDFFEEIILLKNLFSAWAEFKRGKENKRDVARFVLDLEDHLFELHQKLREGTYAHAPYTSFFLHDPKLRHIHKAGVRDRILHHAIVRRIEPLVEPSFIFDSYSSRKLKGSHRAVERLRYFAWKLSRNNTRIVWALQCDIRKFFGSMNHEILLSLLNRRIKDLRVLQLLKTIIYSMEIKKGAGVPLGNLTSQLFSNVYLNPLDQFIKRTLRVKYYIRYADGFLLLDHNRANLVNLLPQIKTFLEQKLKLELHDGKIHFVNWYQGIDFLGYVSFPYHTILRPRTKRRILRKIKQAHRLFRVGAISQKEFDQILASYLGMLRHCRGEEIRRKICKIKYAKGPPR